MKRLIILLCVSCWAVLLQAQQYLVYSVTGHVDVEENGKKREVKLREKLTPQNVLVLAYKAQIVLLDEAAGKQYTLQQPGRAVLKSMLSDSLVKTLLMASANIGATERILILSQGIFSGIGIVLRRTISFIWES